MIVIATGLIFLLPLSCVSMVVIWESSQWFGYNIVQRTGLRALESMDVCIVSRVIPEIILKAAL